MKTDDLLTDLCVIEQKIESLPTAQMQYRKYPEQAISCADREGNGKCGPPYDPRPRCPARSEGLMFRQYHRIQAASFSV